jgi:probable F420-dependent oxidoreductase
MRGDAGHALQPWTYSAAKLQRLARAPARLAPCAFSWANSSAVKLGLFVPLAGDPTHVRETLAAAATTAERAGIHSLWFAEHVALFDTHVARYPYSEDGAFPLRGEAGLLEPFTAIAFAAALTTRIRLGTGVCLVPQRSPLYTAKQVADADVLSLGRLDFGVGIGWLREEFQALGVPFDDRARRCREYLAAMRVLWTEPVARYDGRLLKVPPLRMFPKPIQKPHPPIVFGGESDAALRRVADLGQGWYGFNLLPEEAAARLAVLDRMLAERGRKRSDVEISVSPYMKPARDADALRRYADAGVDQVIHMIGAGGADRVRDDIERLASLKERA